MNQGFEIAQCLIIFLVLVLMIRKTMDLFSHMCVCDSYSVHTVFQDEELTILILETYRGK